MAISYHVGKLGCIDGVLGLTVLRLELTSKMISEYRRRPGGLPGVQGPGWLGAGCRPRPRCQGLQREGQVHASIAPYRSTAPLKKRFFLYPHLLLTFTNTNYNILQEPTWQSNA